MRYSVLAKALADLLFSELHSAAAILPISVLILSAPSYYLVHRLGCRILAQITMPSPLSPLAYRHWLSLRAHRQKAATNQSALTDRGAQSCTGGLLTEHVSPVVVDSQVLCQVQPPPPRPPFFSFLLRRGVKR